MTYIDLDIIYGANVTNETLNANGFYKVSEKGGSFVVDTYYNPTTDEIGTLVARDYDYNGDRDNDSIYNAAINEDAKNAYLHACGQFILGDKVMVIKGRKIPHGTVHTVTGMKDIRDKYGRTCAHYLIFEDGTSTNETNCIMIMNTEKEAV